MSMMSLFIVFKLLHCYILCSFYKMANKQVNKQCLLLKCFVFIHNVSSLARMIKLVTVKNTAAGFQGGLNQGQLDFKLERISPSIQGPLTDGVWQVLNFCGSLSRSLVPSGPLLPLKESLLLVSGDCSNSTFLQPSPFPPII